MDTLEPIVNLLVVLTVLSIASERATNAMKLRSSTLRDHRKTLEGEKARENQITAMNLFLGTVLAILVKADIFQIMTNLDAPWQTLGWVHASGSQWFRDPATMTVGTLLYALGGSAITGIALGFGSKFWHDLLDSVLELKGIARQARERREVDKQVAAQSIKNPGKDG